MKSVLAGGNREGLKQTLGANRAVRVTREIATVFIKKNAAGSAAALSYYLMISVFPFLICVSAILGSLHIGDSGLLPALREIIPENIYTAVFGIIDHLSGYNHVLIIGVGAAALITSASAAYRAFSRIIGNIQGRTRFKGVWGLIFSFIAAIALLAAVYVSGLVIIAGEWLVQIIGKYLQVGNIFNMWMWVRFFVLFLLMFGIIYGMYFITAPKGIKRRRHLPGALSAAVVLVLSSVLFSRMITLSITRYAFLYGSLASFIILLIWLYMCAIILIMGSILNVSLYNSKKT